ncbi:MAG: hypothetical protein IJ855_04400 [Bacteroidales bacterium]|nr:hypothetical protein [Bacteroidales bacterium]
MDIFSTENAIQRIHKTTDEVIAFLDSQSETILALKDENERLRSENYKDSELAQMKKKLAEMENTVANTLRDSRRGFPIAESEERAIHAWMEKHEADAHGAATTRARLQLQGVSGGRYSYRFCPTGIGTSGVVRCVCGAEFEFRRICG